MKYRSFAPLQAELSQLVLGTAYLSLTDLDQSFELLDEWVRLGGNVLDSAHSYGVFAGGERGDAERVLGRWFEARPDVRERVVLLSKGGHPNQDRKRVTPEDLTCDLRDTCARLNSECVDIYLLHRDDPDVAVGPIVEILNEHKEAGRIRCFGVSNWTSVRIDEAAAYAADRGLEAFTCSSCNLALAVQNEAPWPGSLSVSDPISRRWHEQTQMPLFAWSAQAGGFFAVGEEQIRESPDLNRVYVSPENWQRRERATTLAAARNRSANEIALAWVLAQPFPAYAIIGPRTVEELHDSIRALDLELTPRESAWVNLETDDAPEGAER